MSTPTESLPVSDEQYSKARDDAVVELRRIYQATNDLRNRAVWLIRAQLDRGEIAARYQEMSFWAQVLTFLGHLTTEMDWEMDWEWEWSDEDD